MADYTYLNNVPACRIHKSNAEDLRDEARNMLKYYRDCLLVLAASGPHTVDEGDGPVPWCFYVRREIDQMWDEMLDHAHNEWLASYIVENPEDCDDDLEHGVDHQPV